MPHLPNYLRAHRKRLALSQKELTHLLGAESGAKVCRYERFIREPSLKTALACQVVFKKPVSELFAGIYHKIQGEVAARAKTLVARSEDGKSNGRSARRKEKLTAIAAGKS